MDIESIDQSYKSALAELAKAKKKQSLLKNGAIVVAVVAIIALVALIVTQVAMPAQQRAALQAAGLPADLAAGDKIKLGIYEQDGNLENGAEPIEWRVLNVRGNEVLLLAEKGLDTQKGESSNWETSRIKTWLEGEFTKNAWLSNVKGEVTLLSADELTRYMAAERDRLCSPTAYAKSKVSNFKNWALWILRSDSLSTHPKLAYVDGNGKINNDMKDNATYFVRPALKLSL